jgi:hypothetical protein
MWTMSHPYRGLFASTETASSDPDEKPRLPVLARAGAWVTLIGTALQPILMIAAGQELHHGYRRHYEASSEGAQTAWAFLLVLLIGSVTVMSILAARASIRHDYVTRGRWALLAWCVVGVILLDGLYTSETLLAVM